MDNFETVLDTETQMGLLDRYIIKLFRKINDLDMIVFSFKFMILKCRFFLGFFLLFDFFHIYLFSQNVGLINLMIIYLI